MPQIRTIEPRKPTAEPLVEVAVKDDLTNGSFEPTGRRFSGAPRADGLSSYGLTDVEIVAFGNACDRLRGVGDQHYTDATLDRVMLGAGITSATPLDEHVAFVEQYRAQNPLPVAYHELPAGDPCNNLTLIPDPAAAAPAASTPITHVDQLAPAIVIPANTIVEVMTRGSSERQVDGALKEEHVFAPASHVDFLHQLLDAIQPSAEAAAQELAVLAFQAAFKKVFPRAVST